MKNLAPLGAGAPPIAQGQAAEREASSKNGIAIGGAPLTPTRLAGVHIACKVLSKLTNQSQRQKPQPSERKPPTSQSVRTMTTEEWEVRKLYDQQRMNEAEAARKWGERLFDATGDSQADVIAHYGDPRI